MSALAATAHHAYHVLDIDVHGFALGRVNFPVDKEELVGLAVAQRHKTSLDVRVMMTTFRAGGERQA